MCVVDRREDLSAYAEGANRAQVQAELIRQQFQHHGEWESTAVPARVEVENAIQAHMPLHSGIEGAAKDAETKDNEAGIYVVVETPGPAAILKLLLKRVWGVAEGM
jgi:hypothetical protein